MKVDFLARFGQLGWIFVGAWLVRGDMWVAIAWAFTIVPAMSTKHGPSGISEPSRRPARRAHRSRGGQPDEPGRVRAPGVAAGGVAGRLRTGLAGLSFRRVSRGGSCRPASK